MLEVLVAALCIADAQCGEATKAYLASRPAYRQQLRDTRKYVQRKMGPENFAVATATIALTLQQRYQVRINRRTSIDIDKDSVILIYNFSF